MKKILLIAFSLLYLYSCCYDQDPGPEEFVVRLTIPSLTKFSDLGYHSAKILEYDREIDSLYFNSNFLTLPIALNKTTSTYVIYGDTISDTLQVSAYRLEPYIEDYCGYQLRLTPPDLASHTFHNYNVTHSFNEEDFIFSIYLK